MLCHHHFHKNATADRIIIQVWNSILQYFVLLLLSLFMHFTQQNKLFLPICSVNKQIINLFDCFDFSLFTMRPDVVDEMR